MTENKKVPKVVLEAYDLLLQHRIVEISQPIDWGDTKGKKGWVFQCIASVPYPNQENIPSEVPLKVLIPEAFPLAPVDFYSNSEEVKGFPHQDAESGKLCLREERLAPLNAERLVCYTKWAREWLADAANGSLLKPGDPYELPDFSRKLLTEPLITSSPLLFNETGESYEKWKTHVGKSGTVDCFLGNGIPAIFAVLFYDEKRLAIWESGFASTLLSQDKKLIGIWFIIPDIRFKRHRPPQTYEEITQLCSTNGVNFSDILKRAWEADNRSLEMGLILVGFPIPEIWGQKPVEIHWQPLVFSNSRAEQRRFRGGKSRKRGKIWKTLRENGHFQSSDQLPWGRSSNVTDGRLYARGSFSPSIRSAQIAVFGCGALGSLIAEQLARGGVRTLSLFDPQGIEVGNFCRHTLDGTHLECNKAEALARRLSTANPLSCINGYQAKIPPSPDTPQDAIEAISEANMFIDCTASESAFQWLDDRATALKRIMISLFFNFYVDHLTLCISGTESSCSTIFQDLVSCVSRGQLPIGSQEYFYQPSKEEQVIEGAGCWHPTFPALNVYVHLLAAAAVDIINSHAEQENGLAVIVKRNSFGGKQIQPSSLVEIVWSRRYP